MLDEKDYKEPSCALCGGKRFYNPELNIPADFIPINRVMDKLNFYYTEKDLISAEKHLDFWLKEAKACGDKKGELAVLRELCLLYLNTGDIEKASNSVTDCLETVKTLDFNDTLSGADIFNIAGDIFAEKGDFIKAEKYFLRAIKTEKDKCDFLNAASGYISLALLFGKTGEKDKITDSLFNAYQLLCDENTIKDGVYFDACIAFAPIFLQFGYKKIYEDLKTEAENFYERT